MFETLKIQAFKIHSKFKIGNSKLLIILWQKRKSGLFQF